MRYALVAVLILAQGVARADDGTATPTPNVSVQAPRPVRTFSVSVEPALLLMTTFGVVVERSVAPHVSVAVTAGVGHNSRITYGDRVRESAYGATFDELHTLDWTRVHGGVQVNAYFDDQFRGAHVGGEVSYKHFWPDEDAVEDVAVVTGSAYWGWKWLTVSGLTVLAQVGGSVVGMRGDSDSMGWSLNSDGTLNTVHLYGKVALGYSF